MRPSQRGRKRADTRERIFQAAVAEFRRVGFAAAQIPQIAEAAGVVRGTFYFHFPGKDDVLRELTRRNQRQIVAALHALRGQSLSLPEVLARMVDATSAVNESLGDPSLTREVLAMFLRAPADAPPTESEQSLVDELTHHVEVAIERGELRRDVLPEHLAAIVLTSLFGLIVAPGDFTEEERRSGLELLMRVLFEGMGRDASGSSSTSE